MSCVSMYAAVCYAPLNCNKWETTYTKKRMSNKKLNNKKNKAQNTQIFVVILL